MPTESVFQINGWQLLFTLLNLFINYLILKHFLYKPVKKMFEDRKKEVEGTYAKADEAERKALAMRDEYQLKIAAAKSDADEIVRSATKRAQQRSDTLLLEAKNSADSIVTRAHEQIEVEKKRAVNEIKNEIADIALLAAGNVLEKELDEAGHRKMIDDFIENM